MTPSFISARPIAVLAALSGLWPGDTVAQDAAQGEEIFRQCASCHMIGAGARNATGPVLTDVIGRRAGTAAGYSYSDSMTAAGQAGLVWTEARLADYLADPSAYLRDYLDDPQAEAQMPFALADPQDRADVAAYLASLGDRAGADDTGATAKPTGTGPATVSLVPAAPDQVCVGNLSNETHLFAAEAPDGARVVRDLAPGETLCAGGAEGGTGVVSVFESADALEGCSRLVAPGRTEALLRYVDFDRCAWTSNS